MYLIYRKDCWNGKVQFLRKGNLLSSEEPIRAYWSKNRKKAKHYSNKERCLLMVDQIVYKMNAEQNHRWEIVCMPAEEKL